MYPISITMRHVPNTVSNTLLPSLFTHTQMLPSLFTCTGKAAQTCPPPLHAPSPLLCCVCTPHHAGWGQCMWCWRQLTVIPHMCWKTGRWSIGVCVCHVFFMYVLCACIIVRMGIVLLTTHTLHITHHTPHPPHTDPPLPLNFVKQPTWLTPGFYCPPFQLWGMYGHIHHHQGHPIDWQ